MVLITHSGENTGKINQILKVAQKRFGLYGLEKTSMQEIASDLGISKASLYYYFPDKEHLFKEVVEMEQEEFFATVEKTLEEYDDERQFLEAFVRIRLEFFKTYFNLGRFRSEEFKFMKNTFLKDSIREFSYRENEIIRTVLKRGIDKGIFMDIDVEETAALFIETIKGLRMQLIHSREYMYIEPGEFLMLEKKMKALAEIFIRGLTVTIK